ncbi:pancreatic lipase-related protein 2-like [Anopheles marshallii]|uniref:pancreatic lipase-related protein 2-like n=1 Tax=Anopheles marshallii TaxID=1521116 RepID=UPI00237B5745|nr:pancreatic lipase-related protein 2-like [Anopheles marshallii]
MGAHFFRSGLSRFVLIAIIASVLEMTVVAQDASFYTNLITFAIHNSEQNVTTNVVSDFADFEALGCNNSDPFTVIVHGWKESCQTEWLVDMIGNLSTVRNGCIYCMNYNNFSRHDDYFGLVRQFLPISEVLVTKLHQLEKFGYDFDDGYMFGFSYGAHLAFDSLRRFGPGKLGALDVCEPAGPGFDGEQKYREKDPKEAAKNVQCIHTSDNYGTHERKCHQNWNLGRCGKSQDAAGPYPKGSHGLCPYIYNSAFKYDFLAMPNKQNCETKRLAPAWPKGFRMGYFMDRKSDVIGDLFAATSREYPYFDNTFANEVNEV